MHSAVFVAHVISAFSLKLVSSLDDVIWLASFFTPEKSRPQRLWNAATYAAICTLQAVLAWTIAVFGESGTALLMRRTGLTSVSPDQVLTLGAGLTMAVYACVLFRDELRARASGAPKGPSVVALDIELAKTHARLCDAAGEDDDARLDDQDLNDDDEGEDELDAYTANGFVAVALDDGGPTAVASPVLERPSRSLAIVAFLGSLDDLSLFVPMLVGHALSVVELITGAAVATCLIILICVALNRVARIARCLQAVPLVVIVAFFAFYLVLRSFFMV